MSLLYMFQGLGSIIGPLIAGRWLARGEPSMRRFILVGYLAAAVCYIVFSQSENLGLVALTMIGAHAGGALVWVFSTTLLHIHTDDRYRGRVFAADLGLFMVTASAATYLTGWAIDNGISARTAALAVGLAMLAPALAWALRMRRQWEE
jgi:predicted MFS family arabinose efflux permease